MATVKRPPCLCGCGDVPASASARYLPGHDAKMAEKVAAFLAEHSIADVEELFRRYVDRERGR